MCYSSLWKNLSGSERRKMLKIFYILLTDPLGLPIDVWWEYIILLVVGEIVHEIAFSVSPGGTFGSLIYWVTKLLAYVVIWGILYIVIAAVKFIIAHWIWFAVGGGVLVVAVVGWLFYKKTT